MKLRNTSIAGLIAVMLLLTSGCSTAVLFGERGTDGFLDDSTNTTTSEYDVIPSDTPYVPSSTKPSEENNTAEGFFDSFFEDWNETNIPSDIADHAFDLAIRLYIQQYYIPALMPYTSYENIINSGLFEWEPVELVDSEYNPGFYCATMYLSFNADLKGTGWYHETTESFEFNYDPDTSYVRIYGQSWSVARKLLETDYTNDPNHVTLNMTDLPTDVIFDVAEASCLYFIEDIVLPDVGMSSLDEFRKCGCTYEYDREGFNGIKVIQIGDISYSLSMSMCVNAEAATETEVVVPLGEGNRHIYYEDVTVYFDAENVGEADQALTAFYFSWLNDRT